jgi:hypothetical protein
VIKKVLFSLGVFITTLASAQSFGNEWIDYSQKYYEIKVAENGIYRISFANLISAGIPVNSIDPRTFQVFGRGKQVAIFIQGELDNSFDPSDYIEFYAEKNDGWLDEELYKGSSNHPNPFITV